MDSPKNTTHGVQELINKLKNDGVNAGQVEAQRIQQESQRKANEILAAAHNEAETIIKNAKQQAEIEQRATREALQLAFRDSTLKLKELLTQQFATRLKHLTKQELDTQEYLRQLILGLTTQQDEKALYENELIVYIPTAIFDVEALRDNVTEARESELSQFVRSLASDGLREGIEIFLDENHNSGLRIQLKNSDLVFDFTDEMLSEFLLKHLMPRFRAMLDGIV